jgi:outer membrane lipase/esterase
MQHVEQSHNPRVEEAVDGDHSDAHVGDGIDAVACGATKGKVTSYLRLSSPTMTEVHSMPALDHAFTRLLAFGDSFLDTGSFTAVTRAHGASCQARSGTNPSWMWIEHVAAALGLDLEPAAAAGTNYAEAFALADGVMDAIPGLEHLGLRPRSVTEQVEHFLSTDQLGAADLVVINGGGNDALLSVLSGVGAPMIESAADAFVSVLARLAATSATVVAVATPDLGLAPIAGAGAGGDGNPITAAVRSYGATVRAHTATAGLAIPVIDGFAFFRALVASPTQYGLTNTTEPSYATQGLDAFMLGPSEQVADDVSGYLFSDAIHPSATGHRLFGAYAIGALAQILSVA